MTVATGNNILQAIRDARDSTGAITDTAILEIMAEALRMQLEMACKLHCTECWYDIPVDECFIHQDEDGVRSPCSAILIRANMKEDANGMS